jgi:hypothetical protein
VLVAVGAVSLVAVALNLKLSPITALSGPLVVAVCTEFTSLILLRFVEERNRGYEPREAMNVTASRTGRAFMVSGMTAVGGIAVLATSSMPMLADFGIIVAMNVAVALVSALVVLPPVLVWAEEKNNYVSRGLLKPVPEPIEFDVPPTPPAGPAGGPPPPPPSAPTPPPDGPLPEPVPVGAPVAVLADVAPPPSGGPVPVGAPMGAPVALVDDAPPPPATVGPVAISAAESAMFWGEPPVDAVAPPPPPPPPPPTPVSALVDSAPPPPPPPPATPLREAIAMGQSSDPASPMPVAGPLTIVGAEAAGAPLAVSAPPPPPPPPPSGAPMLVAASSDSWGPAPSNGDGGPWLPAAAPSDGAIPWAATGTDDWTAGAPTPAAASIPFVESDGDAQAGDRIWRRRRSSPGAVYPNGLSVAPEAEPDHLARLLDPVIPLPIAPPPEPS